MAIHWQLAGLYLGKLLNCQTQLKPGDHDNDIILVHLFSSVMTFSQNNIINKFKVKMIKSHFVNLLYKTDIEAFLNQ